MLIAGRVPKSKISSKQRLLANGSRKRGFQGLEASLRRAGCSTSGLHRLGLLLFDLFDARQQLVKPGECRILFFVSFDRAGRSSPDCLTLPNRLSSRNPSLCAHNSPILDGAMVVKANLSRQNYALAYRSAA